MAVMQNSIIFGGIDSADFGIYIGGEGVFNAPKRAVEMVTVPGRNGDIAIDQGHYENIEVTYSAFNYEEDLATFAKKLSDFRNAIASQVGYQRLTDTFHPDEYRMAIYTAGLEIDPIKFNTASEFDLKFNCKPQRWLTSGEVPVTIGEWGATKTASGEIVTIESEGGEAAKSLEVSLEPIQSGSGTPSPDNVRPISGRTEVVTYRTDEQLYNPSNTEIGKNWIMGNASDRAINVFAVQPNTKYKVYTSGGNFTDVLFIEMNNSSQVKNTAIRSPYNDYITTSSNTNKIIIQWSSSGTMTTSNFSGYQCSVSKELSTYTTALGRTVYGGTLDVVSGVLTVDTAYRTFNGSENWEKINQGLRLAGGFGGKTYSTKDVSNMLTYATSDPTRNPNSYTFTVAGFVNVGVPYTVAEWKSLLATTNLQVVYELATPQTYQLTPQQIELLLGENHVWSDGAITMQYGDDPDSLWNPTRYDASPLLAVDGYGTISFNGYDIEITSVDYGDITIASPAEFYTNRYSITIPAEYIKSGDTVTLSGLAIHCVVKFSDSSPYHFYGDGRTTPTPTDSQSTATTRFSNHALPLYGTKSITLITAIPNITFTLGTSETWENVATVADLQVTEDYGTTLLVKTTLKIADTVAYDATTQTITITQAMTHSPVGDYSSALTYDPFGTSRYPSRIESAVVNSTMTYLGEPTYIDCDLGEAYKIENGTFISLNSYIDLGSDLPTLASGQNEITIDDTITSLEVTPRWWKL